MKSYLATVILAFAATLLCACGGGDPEPEKDTDPPECHIRPELCK